MDNKEKIESLKPFDRSKYENIALDYLVMFAMNELNNLEIPLTPENAAVACFKMFPNKFSMLGFSHYPDTTRVYSCLWRLSRDKKRQWLGGKAKQGFVLTEKSRFIIDKIDNILQSKVSIKKKSTSETRRQEMILKLITTTVAFKKYVLNDGDNITEEELCLLLQATIDSSKTVLRENLFSLKNFATELNNKEILLFLDFINKKFSNFLGGVNQ